MSDKGDLVLMNTRLSKALAITKTSMESAANQINIMNMRMPAYPEMVMLIHERLRATMQMSDIVAVVNKGQAHEA